MNDHGLALGLVVVQSGLAVVVSFAVLLMYLSPDRSVKRLCALLAGLNTVLWLASVESILAPYPPHLVTWGFSVILVVQVWFLISSIVATERSLKRGV